MLTQCQQCKKTYSTSVEILSLKNRELLCQNCEEMLGQLNRLGRDFIVLGKNNDKLKPRFQFWGLGIALGLILLLAQIFIFEKDKLSQNPKLRFWLEQICLSLDCQLPIYKNLNDFEVIFGAFEQTEDKHYVFQAVISNQGKFSQDYPSIRLNLLTDSGKSFAQRIFTPKEYLNIEHNETIDATKTIEISMKIAKTKQAISNYTFDLI